MIWDPEIQVTDTGIIMGKVFVLEGIGEVLSAENLLGFWAAAFGKQWDLKSVSRGFWWSWQILNSTSVTDAVQKAVIVVQHVIPSNRLCNPLLSIYFTDFQANIKKMQVQKRSKQNLCCSVPTSFLSDSLFALKVNGVLTFEFKTPVNVYPARTATCWTSQNIFPWCKTRYRLQCLWTQSSRSDCMNNSKT